MSAARTTVVIATRNRADELARTLLKLATSRPVPPVIVVDNASTDETASVARSAGAQLVTLPTNRGAAARNVGVAEADTPYVAFADDDSWWAPDALTRAETLLDDHPRLGLVAARTVVGEAQRDDPTNGLMAHSPLGTDPQLPGPSVLGFLACAAVLRTSAYRQVGGFSELLRFVAEEKLLAYDLAAHGWALCYCPSVVAHHHPSPRRGSALARRRLEQRNNALIGWLRRPWRIAVTDTAQLTGAVLTDPGAAPTLAALVRRIPTALRTRRPLPDAVERDIRLLENTR
jgi:GT2 family glycosyltransferase